MSQWSISFSYRLGLGFHALNNEGADGSNLMQPRRIDVGRITYDGISGEIIRRHILENFVELCSVQEIHILPLSAGLHPDRGPIGILAAARDGNNESVVLNADALFPSVRRAVKNCAVLDIGGFLAAWKGEKGSSSELSGSSEKKKKGYVAEKDYVDRYCAKIGDDVDPVKRESCFDVAWLISESPQDSTVTQHSTFRDTAALNMRYSQTMRSNIYGGLIRADLHRIGMDDYWYLQNNVKREILNLPDKKKRQLALIEAIVNFIASPTGAKTAGWAPHVFLTEGSILLSSDRTAPFVSPIKVNVKDEKSPVSFNSIYQKDIKKLANNTDIWTWEFKDTKELLNAFDEIKKQIEE